MPEDVPEQTRRQFIETGGLVTVESDRRFDETVTLIEKRIKESPLTHISTFDHSANAASVNLELPATTVIFFGNPKVGTLLMQSNQTIGIDLPQKILVWESDETVNITYNASQYLAARHGVMNEENLFQQTSRALETLAIGEVTGDDTELTTENGEL